MNPKISKILQDPQLVALLPLGVAPIAAMAGVIFYMNASSDNTSIFIGATTLTIVLSSLGFYHAKCLEASPQRTPKTHFVAGASFFAAASAAFLLSGGKEDNMFLVALSAVCLLGSLASYMIAWMFDIMESSAQPSVQPQPPHLD